MSQIVFMGLILNKHGVGLTVENSKAIRETEVSTNVAELRSFWFTVPGRFRDDCGTTHEFSRQSTKWQRYEDENGAFEALKNQLAEESTMAFYYKEALTKVDAGASFSPAPHIANGFVYATLSLIRLARRLLTICKKIFATSK